MLLWFAVLAFTGAAAIVRNPRVLDALDPRYGLNLLFTHQKVALVLLGGVVPDGDGRRGALRRHGIVRQGPVTPCLVRVVWPALLLSYFASGADTHGRRRGAQAAVCAGVAAPCRGWWYWRRWPRSLLPGNDHRCLPRSRSAVQLDLLPRLRILQTSAHEHGQI